MRGETSHHVGRIHVRLDDERRRRKPRHRAFYVVEFDGLSAHRHGARGHGLDEIGRPSRHGERRRSVDGYFGPAIWGSTSGARGREQIRDLVFDDDDDDDGVKAAKTSGAIATSSSTAAKTVVDSRALSVSRSARARFAAGAAETGI